LSSSKSVRGAAPRAALAILLSAPLVLLTACGGGGGGGDQAAAPGTPAPVTNTPTPAPTSATLVITSTNAKPVAADALDNATNLDAAESGSGFVTGVQVDAPQAGNLALQLAAIARTLAAKVPARSVLAVGVAVSETAPCSGGGTLSINGSVASENGVTAGDAITLGANGCKEFVDGVATELNGQMKLTIVSGSLNGNGLTFPTHIVMRLDATNFSVAVPGQTTRTNGDMTMDMTLQSSTSESLVVSGTSLATTVFRDSGSRSFALQDYRQSVAIDNGAVTASVDAQISSTNPRLGTGTQVYTVATTTALTANSTGTFTGGVLKVTGSSSALLLTVTAPGTFQVQVDANGDGTYETSTTATHAELRALL
jgi:hypothetical protein